MPLPALATIADVEAVTGQAVAAAQTVRVTRLLEMMSALVRAESGQTITAVVADVAELDGPRTQDVWLPQYPVTALTTVAVNGSAVAATGYKWNSRGRLRRLGSTSWWYWPDTAGQSAVTVTYNHGYATVPDDVAMFVAGLVAARTTIGVGVRSISIDGYSESYETGVSLDEAARRWIHDRFDRPEAGRPIMMVARSYESFETNAW